MAEYLDNEAMDKDLLSPDENEDNLEVHNSYRDFIDDDTNFLDQGPSDYRLTNATLSYEQVLADINNREGFECSDPENYVHDSCKEFTQVRLTNLMVGKIGWEIFLQA